jgi:hypothetical protein
MRQQKIAVAGDVEALARGCAREIAQKIRQEAEQRPIALPLDDSDVNHLLDVTIEQLRIAGKIPWFGISHDRHQVFVEAWARELTREGIRN